MPVASHLEELVETTDRAQQARRWADAAASLRELGTQLPARLALLARATIDLIEEGDFELAAHMWAHLEDAIRFDRSARAG
jgi:hypothetical protein